MTNEYSGGWATLHDGTHVPITAEEAKAIWESVERRRREQAERMPNIETALRVMFDAYDRLRELGWREAIYCPKDGTSFEVIEAGSTGVHRCHYSGEWPDGTWLVEDRGDLWPSRPILFRLLPKEEAS